LLTRRQNEPAKGEWFWPGSRLYKGERLDDAAVRVAGEELGLDTVDIKRLGVSEHFWESTGSKPATPSRSSIGSHPTTARQSPSTNNTTSIAS